MLPISVFTTKDGWKFEWEAGQGKITGSGQEVSWMASKEGEQLITVKVTSPWGSVKSAEAVVAVLQAMCARTFRVFPFFIVIPFF